MLLPNTNTETTIDPDTGLPVTTVLATDDYRYGFQGQENDPEVKGKGKSVNYKYRMHDPRVGRFFAVDPLASEYPHNGPYNFSENRVIDAVELEGREAFKDLFNAHDPLYWKAADVLTTKELIAAKKSFDDAFLKTAAVGVPATVLAIAIGPEVVGSYILEEILEEVLGYTIFFDPGDIIQKKLKKQFFPTPPSPTKKILPGDSPVTMRAKRSALAEEAMGGPQHTKYVDLDQPVYSKTISDGEFVQYRLKGNEGSKGDYFAPAGTTPEQIGLDPADVSETFKVTIDKPTKGVFSTHTKNSNLYYDSSRKSVGGGTQIYSKELKNNATFTKVE